MIDEGEQLRREPESFRTALEVDVDRVVALCSPDDDDARDRYSDASRTNHPMSGDHTQGSVPSRVRRSR